MQEKMINDVKNSLKALKEKIQSEQDMTKSLPKQIVDHIDIITKDIDVIEEKWKEVFEKIDECQMFLRIL